MKKLALLLGALSLVSSVAYAKEVVPAVEEVVVVEEAAPVAAAPALRVTSFGQSIEVDNTSGGTDTDEVYLGTSVGLAYEDWTFGVFARKGWVMDSDDGIHSNSHRIDLDVWKNYDNFSVGARWRQEDDTDRYLARVKYNYGMFSGWVDAGYDANNGGDVDDGYYVEAEPLKVALGPVTVGYYFKTQKDIRIGDENPIEHWYRHQARLYFPIYKGEKLSLSGAYFYEFANDMEIDKKVKGFNPDSKDFRTHDEGHIFTLSASYAVTESLSVSGYYEYDIYEWKGETKEAEKYEDDGKYYGEFGLGWTYTF